MNGNHSGTIDFNADTSKVGDIEWQSYLERLSISSPIFFTFLEKNKKKVIKKIKTTREADRQDLVVELQTAWLLSKGIASEIEYEPKGKEGPDFLFQANGHSVFLEVTHLREDKHAAPIRLEGGSEVLKPWPDSSDKVKSKITQKLHQLQEGQLNIVLFVTSHGFLREEDISKGIASLFQDMLLRPERVLSDSKLGTIEDARVKVSSLSAVGILNTWPMTSGRRSFFMYSENESELPLVIQKSLNELDLLDRL